MIYIFGDSHAKFSFKNLQYPHCNCSEPSITMHRIGRDKLIPNFNSSIHTENDTLIFAFGEVDCRCHIQRQKDAGRNEEDIIEELASKYFEAIISNIRIYKNVIITGIIPPTEQNDYENLNGPIRHEFPFVGSDEDRVRFTEKMNQKLMFYADKYNFFYFYPYEDYELPNGCLNYRYSDNCVHIGDNSEILKKFSNQFNSLV